MARLCLVLVLVIFGTSSGVPHKGRILGGNPATPGQFPSIVSINNPDPVCDGSIINKNWVITAAQCIDIIKSTATIVAGTNLAHFGGTIYKIVNLIKHEDFDTDSLRNDIGLIQIDDEFVFDDVTQPTEFIDPEENSTCTVAGWGVTDTVDLPEELQFIEQTSLSYDTCKDVVGKDFGEEQTCALAEEGVGISFGDIGGPLVCDGKLAGIASFFLRNCEAGCPDFYTKPSAYADWIEKNIQSK